MRKALVERPGQDITSVLTLLGGKPVHGDGDFANLAPPLPAPMPDWSPVKRYGGYQQRADAGAGQNHALAMASACGCATSCGVHGHAHASAWGADAPADDMRSFWGAFGCSCWAV